MRIPVLVALMLGLASPALAVTAVKTLPVGTVIEAEHLQIGPDDQDQSLAAMLIGKEVRLTVYQGRPVSPANVGAPTLVDRNQIVPIRYRAGGLVIETEARALGRGSAGETIRAMNLTSRNTVNAIVNPDGTLRVAAE